MGHGNANYLASGICLISAKAAVYSPPLPLASDFTMLPVDL